MMCELRVLSRMLAAVVLIGPAAVVACGASKGPDVYAPEHSAQYTGTKVPPASKDEQAVLASVDAFRTGKPKEVGDLVVVADAPYFAASGRTCRTLLIKRKGARDGRPRLACQDEDAWFFAPSVTGPDD